jgi:hypothetical protein
MPILDFGLAILDCVSSEENFSAMLWSLEK